MKKKKIRKLISNLPANKRMSINKKLTKIGMLINSVEVELIDTGLETGFLIPEKKYFTLWSQFYNLEQMF